LAAYAFAILTLAIVAAFSQRSAMQIQETTQTVKHTREVLDALEIISTELIEVESSARSFAISGKQSH